MIISQSVLVTHSCLQRESREERIGEVGCMTHWLSHTENIQALQGTHGRWRKRGRLPMNFCPSDHGPLLSKVRTVLGMGGREGMKGRDNGKWGERYGVCCLSFQSLYEKEKVYVCLCHDVKAQRNYVKGISILV